MSNIQSQYPPIIQFKSNEPIYSHDFNELQSAFLKVLQEHTHKMSEEILIDIEKSPNTNEKKKITLSSISYTYMETHVINENKYRYSGDRKLIDYSIPIENIFKINDIKNIEVLAFPLEFEFTAFPCKYSIEILDKTIKEKNVEITIQMINQNCRYIRVGLIIKIEQKRI